MGYFDMNNRRVVALAAACLIASASGPAMAKKKVEMSALQIQQMQTKDFESDKNIVFSAVMNVLQDSGYRIGDADKDTGLITGAASTDTKTTWLPFVGFGKSKKTPVVSAYIEEFGPTMTRVRFSFVLTKVKADGFGGNADEEPILDPVIYQDAFEKVAQAIFVREAMRPVAPKAIAPPVAEPVAPVVEPAPAAPTS